MRISAAPFGGTSAPRPRAAPSDSGPNPAAASGSECGSGGLRRQSGRCRAWGRTGSAQTVPAGAVWESPAAPPSSPGARREPPAAGRAWPPGPWAVRRWGLLEVQQLAAAGAVAASATAPGARHCLPPRQAKPRLPWRTAGWRPPMQGAVNCRPPARSCLQPTERCCRGSQIEAAPTPPHEPFAAPPSPPSAWRRTRLATGPPRRPPVARRGRGRRPPAPPPSLCLRRRSRRCSRGGPGPPGQRPLHLPARARPIQAWPTRSILAPRPWPAPDPERRARRPGG
mmetsp:Transcript_22144/g.75952  ORF Transcript_22144/g.75952 Transcript_22144/m.75952 type:complete len:283 (+) Transcript_22144:876-1724(+)